MDNKKDMISIIVPVYNIQDYIEECIESIVNQTYSNLEIILVDDGSEDESLQICQKYAELDCRIIVLHKTNGGLSSARNYGIPYAKGDFLMFVDGDDTIDREMCDTLLKLLKEYDAQISICQSYKDKKRKNSQKKISQYTPETAIRQMLLEKSFNVSAWGKLYASSLFESVCYPEGKLYEDLATTYKVFGLATNIVETSQGMYYYRSRQGSIMNSCFHEEKKDFLPISNELIEFLKKKYPSLESVAKVRCTRYCISFLREIAVSEEDYSDYAECLLKFVKENIAGYLVSNYKIFSKLYAVALLINFQMTQAACKFITDTRKGLHKIYER